MCWITDLEIALGKDDLETIRKSVSTMRYAGIRYAEMHKIFNDINGISRGDFDELMRRIDDGT